MNRIIGLLLIIFLASCGQFSQGGITNKRELRKKKAPSVQIAEDYDKKAKKQQGKTYKNPKKAAKARDKMSKRHKRKGDKYLRKKKRNKKNK